MAILSVLWKGNLWKTVAGFQKHANQITPKSTNITKAPFRNMASDHHHHPKIFHVTPSRFQYARFKDDVHFFAMLGLVPLGTLVFLINLYIGPAELAEIPEGYEPDHWEYYKHPITRFIARYCHPSEQQEYEKYLHVLKEETDRVQWRKNYEKMKILMAERGDYKGPYYIPSEYGRQIRRARYEAEELDARQGF